MCGVIKPVVHQKELKKVATTMIRDEYKLKGFPVNAKNPVLCIAENGEVFLAYNRYSLSLIFKHRNIKKCLGVWPGKINTDCFPLDVESYSNLPAPPEKHRNIDDSPEINVSYEKGVFKKVAYSDRLSDGSIVQVVSEEKELYDYIINVGLKHRNIP